MNSAQDSKGNIMVVDDTIANLKLLETILGRRGYRVRSFPRGRLALAAAAIEPPDLILLDINIPEMNGYEVCARLKADAVLAPIPVIFISALNEMLDKVKGFGCGGVDYISKPFQIEEILARVDNHLNLRRYQQELLQHNARLDEVVRLKTLELAEANQRLSLLDQSKSDFLKLISHELRTPLHGLFGVADLLFASYPPDPRTTELITIFKQSQERLQRIIEDALLLTEIQVDTTSFAPRTVHLSQVLEFALEQTASMAALHQVGLPKAPADLPTVSGDAKLFQRALHALLESAVRFSESGTEVGLGWTEDAAGLTIMITTHGQTVPPEVVADFFKVLGVTQSVLPAGELGLSLPLAKRIVSLFGGSLAVENLVDSGLKFILILKKEVAAGTATS